VRRNGVETDLLERLAAAIVSCRSEPNNLVSHERVRDLFGTPVRSIGA